MSGPPTVRGLESRVEHLARRNEQLARRAAQMKDRLLRRTGDGSILAAERDSLLEEADALLAEADTVVCPRDTSSLRGAGNPSQGRTENAPTQPSAQMPLRSKALSGTGGTGHGVSTEARELHAECAQLKQEHFELAAERRIALREREPTQDRLDQALLEIDQFRKERAADRETRDQTARALVEARRQQAALAQQVQLLSQEHVEDQSRRELGLEQQVQAVLHERQEDQQRYQEHLAMITGENTALQREVVELRQERCRQDSVAAEHRRLIEELEQHRASSTLSSASPSSRRESQSPWAAFAKDELDQDADKTDEKDHNTNNAEQALRRALTNNSTTREDLAVAVASVEALLQEAKRELAAKQLRERRAAIQELHEAVERADEDPLAQAITRARLAEVHTEDVEKAVAKLRELQSMTDEQRAAKASRVLEVERKRRAFAMVKRDDAQALSEFLASLEESSAWQGWKDYAGRTLWKCSIELRATRVQQALRPWLGMPHEGSTTVASAAVSEVVEAPPIRTATEERMHTEKPLLVATLSPKVKTVQIQGVEAPSRPGKADDAELKTRAFRAVTSDNATVLQEVLDTVPMNVWSDWRNKAGTDLLTLAQERGATQVYSALATALGVITELPREVFEDRETVWVFFPGDVQPRRATVMEDTPEEANEVLVEFWDGDAPPMHADRCSVRKMGS